MSKKTQSYTNRKHRKYIPERMPGNVAVKNKGGWLPGANGRAAKVEALLRGRKEETKEIAGNMAGYKDSGVEEVNFIPKDWNTLRMKDAFNISKEIIGDKWTEAALLSLTTNGVKSITADEQVGKRPKTFATYQRVTKNDIVMCLFDLDASAVFSGLSGYDGMISPAYKILKTKEQVLPEFANYYFQYIFEGRKYKKYAKSIRYTLSGEEFLRLLIVLPPLHEQQRIADFLDTKCSILDRTIDAVSRQIEDLEKYKKALITKTVTKGICKKGEPERAMKDSGVEWIGEDIPFDWDINRLQFCIDEISERNYAGKETHILSLMKDKGVIPYEEKGRVGNISKTDLTQYKLAYPNTLITNSMNIIIGSSGISQYKGCVSPAYYVFKAKPNNDIRYFNYIFAVRAFQNECRRFANGILEIRLRISSTNLLKIKVPVPSPEEQQQIADYLDEKCKNIDNRVQKRRQQLGWLKEYKKSLIFDYVTGKKRV